MDELNNAVKFIKFMQDMTREKINIIYLDRQDKVIYNTYHPWSIEGIKLYPEQIASIAQTTQSSSVILIHDQPSGNIAPMQEDRQLAISALASLRARNIELRDYIINAGAHRYYSMADNMMLNERAVR